jgi:hypothetical protein
VLDAVEGPNARGAVELALGLAEDMAAVRLELHGVKGVAHADVTAPAGSRVPVVDVAL